MHPMIPSIFGAQKFKLRVFSKFPPSFILKGSKVLDTLEAWMHPPENFFFPSSNRFHSQGLKSAGYIGYIGYMKKKQRLVTCHCPKQTGGVTGAAGNTSRVQPRADCSDTPAGRYVIWYLHLELDRAA